MVHRTTEKFLLVSLLFTRTMASSSDSSAVTKASNIMTEFASNTGLEPETASPRRYLWTDAFAVCNFLHLHNRTSDGNYKLLALKLVDQVHWTLGRHRTDDERSGWLSGLSEADGKLHPTQGGLRIGKQMQERSVRDGLDEDLEWDRDGQYYHYLTKWMHALTCVSAATGDPKYTVWAGEMAKAVHAKFTYDAGGRKRMYWKMSIDLSRPQVPSMGHHDPLDGYITYMAIQTALPAGDNTGVNLEEEIADMANICKGKDWVTTDPLGLGGLLTDAYRVMSMVTSGRWLQGADLLETILEASVKGLQSFSKKSQLDGPAAYRLAFRELGLAIGFHGIPKMQEMLKSHPELSQTSPKIEKLLQQLEQLAKSMMEPICGFWSKKENRKASSWTGHLDINMVMLATGLAPDGFLMSTT